MRLVTIALIFIAVTILLVIHEGGRTMAERSEASKASIPPVDRDVPAQIETATFALG